MCRQLDTTYFGSLQGDLKEIISNLAPGLHPCHNQIVPHFVDFFFNPFVQVVIPEILYTVILSLLWYESFVP